MDFKSKLWVEYPIPAEASVWGGDAVDSYPIDDLDNLIESCVDELTSDVLITSFIEVNGITTQLPEDTVSVLSAKLNFPFQGNRFVKFTFDVSSKKVMLRYYPSTVTFRRRLRVSDLENLSGDLLRFSKYYILGKMSEKELVILKSVDLRTDNSSVNLDSLASFMTSCQTNYKELKPEILLYAPTF